MIRTKEIPTEQKAVLDSPTKLWNKKFHWWIRVQLIGRVYRFKYKTVSHNFCSSQSHKKGQGLVML